MLANSSLQNARHEYSIEGSAAIVHACNSQCLVKLQTKAYFDKPALLLSLNAANDRFSPNLILLSNTYVELKNIRNFSARRSTR
ncbi:MAG: hypothetical protein ACJAXQ_000244 [Parvibaculaceae bacterium]|jgi:hypothetical protein